MADEITIELRDVQKWYGDVHALRGVSLTVKRGEIFGFLGPNGAGKTTTIRCMLGMIFPQAGHIRILGLDALRHSVEVRARTGYLPGELHLDESMTAEAHLRFFNDVRGGKADWAYVHELAERLRLDLHRPIRNLSLGNKQKVGVIQALMHRPELLIMDEPTTGLDPLMQREVLQLLREAAQSGATVFFSSHIMSEVEAVAQRVGIIRRGRVVEVAEPETLIRRALRRVRVRFREPVAEDALADLEGVSLLEWQDGTEVWLEVRGTLDALVQRLATLPLLDMDVERPSLEEVFLAYYANGDHDEEGV
ncbi:ABC-2 type transport system ATP-binding protein [Ardenticatena maritima]|uniref:ABC-2 type transport system ATP-binding protein n=1 Tax=Ardenticatena maritima TaxID=872965 RepID=A0A0M9UDG7_9CHLR|nr:ABC transporter ATP-binding protein [Ardenticatena maritima]KPL85718.1 hypothetical protein SE16_15165 [Ardenticatena maritima]GAP63987.1 ABC-2 type transport system ATP-binding protein [Ardenticatena maritima]